MAPSNGYRLTAACACARALEFERGWCHRCGRLLDPIAVCGGGVDKLALLDEGIDTWRPTIRQWAALDGIDVTDPGAYRAWLEMKDRTATAAGMLMGAPKGLL